MAPARSSHAAASGSYREWTIGVIPPPRMGPDGLRIDWDGGVRNLAWEEIVRAFASEVGEPEGVRAVVFDLLSASEVTGPALVRFCIDPSDGPKAPAQTLIECLGEERCSPSLRTLAREGSASDCFFHLQDLDQSLLETLATSTSLLSAEVPPAGRGASKEPSRAGRRHGR